MPFPIQIPELSAWAAQLAGILPLTALVDFIDVPSKLHSFELAASVPLWNWPITPAAARLLLSSDDDNLDACCLDSVKRCLILHCIDGRFGDAYPSSAPATSRLCMQTRNAATVIPNKSPNMQAGDIRKQKLKIIALTKLPEQPKPRGAIFPSIRSTTYLATSVFGWICWTGATLASLNAGLYIAAAYLILMPLTGFIISLTHGNTPRRLIDNRPSQFPRIVVATDSFNGSEWCAFYGGSFILNSLLNKPLYRADTRTSWRRLLDRTLLQLLIVSQWALSVGSCALRDWNALVIFMWLIFCVFYSAYVHPLLACVQDWLWYNCNIAADRIEAEFSTRRSMLSALVYLNPDSKEKRTKWIDPILRESEDRRAWETALLNYMSTGKYDETIKVQYWWTFIEEGYEMGKIIQNTVQAKMGAHT